MKNWRETIKRTGRTFIQAFAGFVAVNIGQYAIGVDGDVDALRVAIKGLIISAVAAGIAAVMNLPKGE